MAKKTKKKRRHTITGRSILYMVLMGLVMIIGTSIAAGYRLFDANIDIYEEYANSYANMIASNIPPEDIAKYTDMDRRLETQGEEDGVTLDDLREKIYDDEEYRRITVLLLTSVSYANLRYIYVVVPREEDMTYLWHVFHIDTKAEKPSEQEEEDLESVFEALEHVPYTGEEEKEVMKSVMDGTWDGSLYLRSDLIRKQALGTALSPVMDAKGNIVAVVGVDIDLFAMVVSIFSMCLNIILAISVILIICIIILYFMIRHGIIRPILTLKKATTDLVENLESSRTFEVDVHSGDEIEALARSFEEMDVKLKQYLQENEAITAERERLSTELSLARRIQADMLPSEFPAFPDRKEFDIYASMTPAKEVGGDFYNFFLIDDNHLALVIADVSGKGIPAALFMMMSKIMLQNYAMTGLSPKDVLGKVNNQICKNREEMFVTVWLGILNIQTGVITASNAGHEYPMLKNAGGTFELVKDKHSLVLGGMEDISYREYELKLEPGSTLFVYTDGVAEATDKYNKLFGTDRTLEALNEDPDRTPKELLEAVDRYVAVFVGDAPQFDDLTMLGISWFGDEDMKE